MSNIKKEVKKNGEIVYKAHVYLGIDSVTNKQRQTVIRGRTKKEVKDKIILKKNEFMENGNTTVKAVNQSGLITFEESYNEWREKLYDDTVERSTLRGTMNIFNGHILPFIGGKPIDSITLNDCQEIMAHFQRIDYQNINKAISYSTRVFKYAINEGYTNENPFQWIQRPNRIMTIEDMKKRKEKEKNKYYTSDEVKEFLKYAEEESVEIQTLKWRTFFHLLFASGLRFGEITALTWKDINFEEESVSVTKANSRDDKYGIYLKSPKTLDSYRTIPLVNLSIIDVLKEWKREQEGDYALKGLSHSKDTLVFPNTRNKALAQSTVRNRLNRFLKKYELKHITPHIFRHTYSTLLYQANNGSKQKEISGVMGHSTVDMTLNTYTHAAEVEKKNAVEKLQDFANL